MDEKRQKSETRITFTGQSFSFNQSLSFTSFPLPSLLLPSIFLFLIFLHFRFCFFLFSFSYLPLFSFIFPSILILAHHFNYTVPCHGPMCRGYESSLYLLPSFSLSLDFLTHPLTLTTHLTLTHSLTSHSLTHSLTLSI